jgi:hypothetical protein
MGIPTKGILAPFKNRIGTVVGRRWRAGLWTMNSYQAEVKNPKTEAQQLLRMRFAAAGRLASAFVDCLDVSLYYFLRHHPTTQVGEFVKRNLPCITATSLDSLNIDYSGITLCDGPLPTVGFNAPNFDTPGQVTVSFNANLDINSASADDKVFVFVYCPDAGQGILSPEVKRNDGSTKVTVPEMWNGLKVHLWGFVYSDKLNRKRPNSVSTSNYLGSGNIG